MTFTCRREAGRWVLRLNGTPLDAYETLGGAIAARLSLPLHSGQNA